MATLVLVTFVIAAGIYGYTEGVRQHMLRNQIHSPLKQINNVPGLNFTYFIHTDEKTQKVTLVLYDHSATAGGMTLTNGIEKAIEHVCLENDLKTALVNVVYIDTEGTWDGFDTKTGKFIHLKQETAESAIEALDNYYLTLKN